MMKFDNNDQQSLREPGGPVILSASEGSHRSMIDQDVRRLRSFAGAQDDMTDLGREKPLS